MSELSILRKSKGLSQKELAGILDVSPKSVSAWELGTRIPKITTMQKIEDFFGVDKENIFSDAFDYSK